ncbi:hypothetical protein Tco_1217064 [Tanacetum coccineum]
MQKNVLKHQFENFVTASNETLDKAYDRFQKLISQLEIHGAYVSKEDINQKFLRSLPPSWSQIALIMRNKPDIDEIDIDDLYNNLKVYEDEMKKASTFLSNTQNLAFLSSKNTNSTNEVSTVNGDFRVSAAGGINQMDEDNFEELDLQWQVAMLTVRVKKLSAITVIENGILQENVDLEGVKREDLMVTMAGASNDFEVEPVNYALMAISSSSSSDSEVRKCSKQYIKSFKCLQKNYDTEREKHNKAKLKIRGYEIALESLESRILRHEKNELAWEEKYEFQNYKLKCREIKVNNLTLELEKVVKERDELKEKIAKWEDSSKNLDEILNSQMSARDKTGLGYSTQLNELSSNHETDNENSFSVFDGRTSDEVFTPTNDTSSKADGYKAVPFPITGNFLTPRADISFTGLDEYAIRNKIIKSQTSELNTKTSETADQTNAKKPKSASESVVSNPKINRNTVIIEDWHSDEEEEESEVQTVRPETQTVKTRDDKSGQNSKKQGIGSRKVKACFVCKSTDHLIKDCNFYAKRSQESKLKNMVNTVLTKTRVISTARPSISTVRPVSTARQSISTARPVSTARPSICTAWPVSTVRQSVSTAGPVRAFRPIYSIRDNVRPRVVHTGKGKLNTDLKRSKWVWRPKGEYLDHVSKESGSFMLKKGNPKIVLQDHAVVDSGCSSHMTGNKAYLSDYENFNGGFVAFRSDPKGVHMANLKYSDKHNMVVFLKKPNESVGFTEVVDFLKGTSLRYALTHNPTIYDSLVKQFWKTATVRTLANGTQQLVASIDSKEYNISEASVRSKLQLADTTGILNLSDAKIYAGLATLGYVTEGKLTFWKKNFTPQWKFLIHHILHCISPKSGGWDQFDSSIATALICLSSNMVYNFSKMIFDGMVHNTESNTKFLMYPRFLQIILDITTENKGRFLAPTLTKMIFANMKRGYARDFVPLLPAMLAGADIDQGEGSAQPAEAHHTPVDQLPSPHHSPLPSPHHLPLPSPLSSPHHSPLPSPHIHHIQTLLQLPTHSYFLGSYEAPLPEGNTSGSSKDSLQLKALMDLKVKSLETTLKRKSKKVIISELEVSLVKESMKEKSTDFVTPIKASGEAQEEDISPTILEAAKTLSKVASQEEVNTGIKKVSTDSTKVDSGTASKRSQREGKAPMVEEDVQVTHGTKEQIRQEEAGLEESIKLQAQMDEEVVKQIHLDVMIDTFVPINIEATKTQLKRYREELQTEISKKQRIDDKDVSVTKVKEEEPIFQQGERSIYHIIRANGADTVYMSFGAMLKNFTRDDLIELYRTMFNPPLNEDAIWSLTLQQKIISWRYYDKCAVHCLTLEARNIYMLVDRKYPLSKDAYQVMLKMKPLDGKINEVCYKLLKMIEKQAGVRK